MTPETFSAMKDAEIFIVRAQPEIDIRITGHPVHADQYQAGGAYVHVPVNTGGGGGGGGAAAAGILIFAAIAVAVANSVKQKKANEWIAPVRGAVPDAKVEERLKRMIDRDFRSISWIKSVPVPILDDSKNIVLEEKLYTSKADAVGIVTPYYQFDYSMTTLRVGMYFELFSASEALTKIVGKSQSQPVPYYAVHRYWDVSVPADQRGETEAHAAYWSAENAKHTRAALAEGVEFATAQVRETLRDPQIYRPNQVIVQKPAATPESSKGFKTLAERDHWYAIRFSEVEEKWNRKGGKDYEESMRRELESLADECRAAAITDGAKRNDEACSVKAVLATLRAKNPESIAVPAKVVGRPLKKGFRRLNNAEIKVLFEDTYIENYPGHWQIEFSPNNTWKGSQANWSPIDGYGTWAAKDDLHCLKVEDVTAYWNDVVLDSCFQVWVDEVAGIVRMIDPAPNSHWVLAKEHAYGEIERMIVATEAVPDALPVRDESAEKQSTEKIRSETATEAAARKPAETGYRDVEAKRSDQGTGASADGLKRQRTDLASECRSTETETKATRSRKDDGCAAKPAFAKRVTDVKADVKKTALTSRISRFSLQPNAEGYRRLDTQEIKILFKDAYIENYPGHWQMEFSANGKWEGLLSNWGVTEGYGTWTARDGLHCIKVEGRSSSWADTDEQGCYQVWIDEKAGNIRMIDPTVVSAWVLAKENAFGEVARLQETLR